jgi:hypothetical protein
MTHSTKPIRVVKQRLRVVERYLSALRQLVPLLFQCNRNGAADVETPLLHRLHTAVQSFGNVSQCVAVGSETTDRHFQHVILFCQVDVVDLTTLVSTQEITTRWNASI